MKNRKKKLAILFATILFLSVGATFVLPKAFADDSGVLPINEDVVDKSTDIINSTEKQSSESKNESVEKEQLPKESTQQSDSNKSAVSSAENATEKDVKNDADERSAITPYMYTKGMQMEQNNGSPLLTVDYGTSDSDPWKKGTIQMRWQDNVKIVVPKIIGIPNILKLLDQMRNGLGFKIKFTFPDEILAADAMNAIDYNSTFLKVGDGSMNLDPSVFSVDPNDPHAMILTVLPGNNDSWFKTFIEWLFGILRSIFTGGTLDKLDIDFHVNMDVGRLTAKGDSRDISPGKVLTKEKLPPATKKNLGFRANFYASSDLNPDMSIIPENVDANPAIANMATWNSYISPWDNNGKLNTETDSMPEVTGVNKTLPGGINNRSVTLDYLDDGTFDKNPNRFNRVINFFTHTDVTSGATLNHTPAKIPSFNQETSIVYAGTHTDIYGRNTKLSPVPLKVTEHYEPMTISLKDNKTIYKVNEPIKANISWIGKMNERALFYYKVSPDATWTAVPGAQINDPMNTDHDFTIDIPEIATEGTRTISIFALDENTMFSNQISYEIQVLKDVPQITSEKMLENWNTGQQGKDIDALSGDMIGATITFDNIGTGSLYNPVLTAELPESVTLAEDMTFLNIEGFGYVQVPDEYWQNGKLNLSLKEFITEFVGDHISPDMSFGLEYHFTVNNDVYNKKLSLPSDLLYGELTEGSGKSELMNTANATTINVGEGELKFEVPSQITYKRSKIPLFNQEIERVNPEFSIDISDTQHDPNWVLSVTQTNTFSTANNDVLSGNLIFKNGIGSPQEIKNTPTIIYMNGKMNNGKVPGLTWGADQGLLLNVLGNQKYSTTSAYTTDLTWNISKGPQE